MVAATAGLASVSLDRSACCDVVADAAVGLGREVVTVPAGQFDCVVLVMRARSLSGDWTGYERWWFSPQAQGYVRMEYRYGPDAEGSRVLMTYALPTEAGQPGDPASARTAER